MTLAETPEQHPRFAIYYSPEANTPLWSMGTGWIGRDALSDQRVEPQHRVNVTELERQALTVDPAHYGLHATLKAPFELHPAYGYEDLRQCLAKFSAQKKRFKLPSLKLKNMDGFVALVPAYPGDMLNELAQECVEAFDEFRLPASPRELAVYKDKPMTQRQYELLLKWGYPYVMEAFRFHITLSKRTFSKQCDKIIQGLSSGLQKVNQQGVEFDSLCLFYQPERNRPFTLLERFSFATQGA